MDCACMWCVCVKGLSLQCPCRVVLVAIVMELASPAYAASACPMRHASEWFTWSMVRVESALAGFAATVSNAALFVPHRDLYWVVLFDVVDWSVSLLLVRCLMS